MDEILIWLEGACGNMFDFKEDMEDITNHEAFTAPVDWFNKISITMEHLAQFIEAVGEHEYEMPDDLPDADNIIKMVVVPTLNKLIEKLNEVKKEMNIDTIKIVTANDVNKHSKVLALLIQICIDTNATDIIKKLTEFEDNYDDSLSELLGITPQDYYNIYSTITDLNEEYDDFYDEE